MKTTSISLTFVFISLFTGFNAFSQSNDDIYFDGVEEKKFKQENYLREETVTATNEYDKSEDQYVDDDFDYQYSTRIRRFHTPARGFSYYSNYYVDNYWYDPFMAGVNIYTISPYYNRYSWGWGYPYAYGYNPNFYSGWNSWGSFNHWGYGYSPYGGYNQFYGNPYWSGYNSGYWNGFNQGYWNGWYGNGLFRNNNINWFENSAPNAANFVTNRSSRGSDAGLHRSRNTAVQGYDLQQRRNNNVIDNQSVYPDRSGRQIEQQNTNTRPNRAIDQPVREYNVRDRSTTNPPVIRESNPGRSGITNPPSNNSFDRGSRNNSFNNNSINNSSFNNSSRGSTNSGSSGSSGSSRSNSSSSGGRNR
jgi:hypothetical protein